MGLAHRANGRAGQGVRMVPVIGCGAHVCAVGAQLVGRVDISSERQIERCPTECSAVERGRQGGSKVEKETQSAILRERRAWRVLDRLGETLAEGLDVGGG